MKYHLLEEHVYYKKEPIEQLKNLYENNFKTYENLDPNPFTDYFLTFIHKKLSLPSGISHKLEGFSDPTLLLASGDLLITTETINLCMDLAVKDKNILRRHNALLVLNELMLIGDAEAFITLANESMISDLFKQIINIKADDKSLSRGKYLFPEVKEQFDHKLKFYWSFFLCLENWAEAFPSDPFQSAKNVSKFRKYYLKLKELGFEFPPNPKLPSFIEMCK